MVPRSPGGREGVHSADGFTGCPPSFSCFQCNVSQWSQLLTTKKVSHEVGPTLSCLLQLTIEDQVNQMWVAVKNSQGQSLERIFLHLVRDKSKGGCLPALDGPHYNAARAPIILYVLGIGQNSDAHMKKKVFFRLICCHFSSLD